MFSPIFPTLILQEVATLKHDDFNVISNTIRVRRSETRYKNNEGKDVYEVVEHPKTKHGYREIVVPSAYSGLLEKLYFMSTSTEYVFEEKGKRVTTLLIRKREYNLCKKLGIHKKSPHKIRATYDTILLDSGLDKSLLQTKWDILLSKFQKTIIIVIEER